MPVYLPPKTMPELPIMYSGQQQTLRDSPKKGFELMTKSKMLEFPTEPPPRAPAVPLVDNSVEQREEKKPLVSENTTKKKILKDVVSIFVVYLLSGAGTYSLNFHIYLMIFA